MVNKPEQRFCPRAFGDDMTDPRNLAYCQQIQRERGEACRKQRCMYCDQGEAVEQGRVSPDDRPEPVQRGLF